MEHPAKARVTVRRLCVLVSVALAAATALGSTASAAPAPIKVGQLVTEGASVGFATTASKTVKAFFQDYNAQGGFKGRKVEVTSGNDSLNVEKNVALTKQMIDAGVVSLVGNFSVPICLGNASSLQQANLYSIGFGNQQNCFNMKQYGSVTPSIPTTIVLSAQYAKAHIGGKVCFIAFNLPGADLLYQRAYKMLEKLGTKLTYKTTGLSPTTDPTAALLEAKSAGCNTTLVDLTPAQDIQAINAKATQKINNMNLMVLSGYDPSTLKATGKNGEGVYFYSHLYPFSNNDSRTKAYRRFCKKHGINTDIFGEQAYISAQLFVDALKRTKGAVTRQSVGTAISKLNVPNSLLPSGRFVYGGQGSGNAPNTGGHVLRIRAGKFVDAPRPQLVLPASVRSLAGK